MPENIRISVVEIPYNTERSVYFAGNKKASCIYNKVYFFRNIQCYLLHMIKQHKLMLFHMGSGGYYV